MSVEPYRAVKMIKLLYYYCKNKTSQYDYFNKDIDCNAILSLTLVLYGTRFVSQNNSNIDSADHDSVFLTAPANVTLDLNDTYETFAQVEGCDLLIYVQIGNETYDEHNAPSYLNIESSNTPCVPFNQSGNANSIMNLRTTKVSITVTEEVTHSQKRLISVRFKAINSTSTSYSSWSFINVTTECNNINGRCGDPSTSDSLVHYGTRLVNEDFDSVFLTVPANVTLDLNDRYQTFAQVEGCNSVIGIQIGDTEYHEGDSNNNPNIVTIPCVHFNQDNTNIVMNLRTVVLSITVTKELLNESISCEKPWIPVRFINNAHENRETLINSSLSYIHMTHAFINRELQCSTSHGSYDPGSSSDAAMTTVVMTTVAMTTIATPTAAKTNNKASFNTPKCYVYSKTCKLELFIFLYIVHKFCNMAF